MCDRLGDRVAPCLQIYRACEIRGRIAYKRSGGSRLITQNDHWKSQIRHALYTSERFVRCAFEVAACHLSSLPWADVWNVYEVDSGWLGGTSTCRPLLMCYMSDTGFVCAELQRVQTAGQCPRTTQSWFQEQPPCWCAQMGRAQLSLMRVPSLVVHQGPPAVSRAPSMPWMMPYPCPRGASAPGTVMLAGNLCNTKLACAWHL